MGRAASGLQWRRRGTLGTRCTAGAEVLVMDDVLLAPDSEDESAESVASDDARSGAA